LLRLISRLIGADDDCRYQNSRKFQEWRLIRACCGVLAIVIIIVDYAFGWFKI
jgi:hypothetical protein